MKAVTEQDIRIPEFIGASLEDLEFRADGKVVRKDRWEQGVRRIAGYIGWSRREFEIDDLVEEVVKLIHVCGQGIVGCNGGPNCHSYHE
jgi:hypothetical protein